jgi:hypothetical protein
MTSFGATNKVFESGFMPTFKVQSQVYDRAGSIMPSSDSQHKFFQIYFMGDERLEAKQRCNNIPDAHHDTVTELQQMLHEHNMYVHVFKTALQTRPSGAYKVMIHTDKKPAGEHERRFQCTYDRRSGGRHRWQRIRQVRYRLREEEQPTTNGGKDAQILRRLPIPSHLLGRCRWLLFLYTTVESHKWTTGGP